MEIFKGAAPYIVCNVLVLISISIFPVLTTWLPVYWGINKTGENIINKRK